jgi:hypothetical protein
MLTVSLQDGTGNNRKIYEKHVFRDMIRVEMTLAESDHSERRKHSICLLLTFMVNRRLESAMLTLLLTKLFRRIQRMQLSLFIYKDMERRCELIDV